MRTLKAGAIHPEAPMTDAAAYAQIQELSAALAALVAKAAPGVVSVHSQRSRSSGFVWRVGLIVTADEALSEEGKVAVTLPGGETEPAQVMGRDPTSNVAVLRVDRSDLPLVSLSGSPVATGALAVAIGAEDGASTAALGVVSRLAGPWRSLRGGEIDARIELDLALRRSGEGGLALDAAGRAFGMAVFGPRRRVLVIPSATIERVATTLQSHGRIARGYLGLGLQPVAIDGSDRSGAMVMSVDPEGPGAKAGIYQGDILVAWNDEPIANVQSLLRALGPDSVGRTITLGLRRGGETRQVPVTIGERAAA
jgi:S1-C subfamily serine protease